MAFKKIQPASGRSKEQGPMPLASEIIHPDKVIKGRFRSMLKAGQANKLAERLRETPREMKFLIELIDEGECRVPGLALLGNMARSGDDIKGALPMLKRQLYSDDPNVRAYAARALSHHGVRRGRMDKVESQFFHPYRENRYGAAHAMKEAATSGNKVAMMYLAGTLFSSDEEAREYSHWALKEALERSDEFTRQDIRKHLEDAKSEARNSDEIVQIQSVAYLNDLLKMVAY